MASASEISKNVQELIEIVIEYLKQQTLVPLKRLGRYLALGIVGSIFMSLGLFLLSLGFLRYLQTLSTFDSNLSFVPYLLVVTANLAVIGILFFVMSNPKLIREKSKK